MRKVLLAVLLVVSVFGSGKGLSYRYAWGYVDSAVLMPNGKGFYTYKRGLVTKWQLNPIQPVDSFRISEEDKTYYLGLRENIFITKDNQRLIYKSRKVVQLWDLEHKHLIKEIKPDKKYGALSYGVAAYSDYGFILWSYGNELQLLDDDSLEVLKQIHLPRDVTYQDYKNEMISYLEYQPYNMIVGQNILHINYHKQSFYVDLETLQILDSSDTTDEDRNWLENARKQYRKSKQADLNKSTATPYFIPPNRKKYFQKYENKFNPIVWKNFMKYIWNRDFHSTLSAYQIDSRSSIVLYKLKYLRLYRLEYTTTSLDGVVKTARYLIWQYKASWYVEDENAFFNASEDIQHSLYFSRHRRESNIRDREVFERYKKSHNKSHRKILKIEVMP